ncbi:hypothetical protein DPMN_111218 [Dreissena polymorpha]|uniref:Uncharacterized protein n=1 Tax=Dreissena polymorpha TaxID=45954 RepID=A0A9D4KDF5_DREPO|nr:hypothetical protein DPMN_111218 [Dreissena polymorpha]
MTRQRSTRAPHVEIDPIVIREVQYQLEVNRCRNEEIIVKDNFGWVWPIMGGVPQVKIDFIVIRDAILGGRGLCGRGFPGLVMGPCIAEIDRIVIREVQYQFEVNRCRNKEIIAGAPQVEIDLSVIREAQHQFEVNRYRNEEVNVK